MYELDKNIFSMHMALFFEDGTDVPILKVALKLQEEFKIVFPKEPEIVPLPSDAPKEIPRCTFKNDRNATLSLSLNRIDFNGGFKAGIDWKNQINIIFYNLLKICEKFDIKVVRIGVVVQALGDDNIIDELNDRVSIEGFAESEEKNVSFVMKKQVLGILLNVIGLNKTNGYSDYSINQGSFIEGDRLGSLKSSDLAFTFFATAPYAFNSLMILYAVRFFIVTVLVSNPVALELPLYNVILYKVFLK